MGSPSASGSVFKGACGAVPKMTPLQCAGWVRALDQLNRRAHNVCDSRRHHVPPLEPSVSTGPWPITLDVRGAAAQGRFSPGDAPLRSLRASRGEDPRGDYLTRREHLVIPRPLVEILHETPQALHAKS
jgi:hypothetical protein